MRSSIQDIALLGSGSAAAFFGNLFIAKGKHISFINSRNAATAQSLAGELNTVYSEHPDFSKVDLVLVAVKDDEISNAIGRIGDGFQGIVVHCAGSVGLDALERFEHHGVFYPLQSLKGETREEEIPFLMEYSDDKCAGQMEKFCSELGILHQIADSEKRFAYHLAAVFVNNFTNAVLSGAEKLALNHHLDMRLLYPLIRKTFENVLKGNSPKSIQTGPAKRGDEEVMNKHLEMLGSDKALINLYKAISEFIKLNT